MKKWAQSFQTLTRRSRYAKIVSGKGNADRLSKYVQRLFMESTYSFCTITSNNNTITEKHYRSLLTHAFKNSAEYAASEFDGGGCILYFKEKSHLSRDAKYPFDVSNTAYTRLFMKRDTTDTKVKGESVSTSIIHSDDAISTRMFANWITSRYSFSLDKFIAIQEPTIEKILQSEKFDDAFELKGGYTNYLAYNDEALIIISQKSVEGEMERSKVFFEIFAKDIECYRAYYEWVMALDERSKQDTLIIEYHSIYADQFSGINANVEYFKKDIFEDVVNDFYAPYLDTDLMFKQYLESKSVILQLTGKPGLGKSKLIALFVKYLAEHPEYTGMQNKIKIARPATSEVLAEEDFWVKLRQEGFHALVLDDVDHILQTRNESITSSEEKVHNEIIRKILTFTDGLTSQKSKILVSTNLEYHKIDKALVRDFRLFDSIELRPLQYEEAKDIWIDRYGLDISVFESLFDGIEEITAANLSKEIEGIKNNFEFDKHAKTKSYLRENGISKIHSLRSRSGRIGLV